MGAGHASSNKVSVYQAAETLGITVDAIRKRIQRGKLPHERGEDGRVWVQLDTTSHIHDDVEDTYRTARSDDRTDELLGELRDRIEDLREQLAAERASRLRADETIAQLSLANSEQARTIRALEAPAAAPPPEPPEAPETGPEMPMGATRSEASEATQEGSEPRRSWWREFFGFN
jgi:hypothetical protein